MSHQRTALALMADRVHFGLGMEQGTGKTWALLADAEHQYAKGRIDAIAILAPNGVHTNWVRREIPTHVDFPNIAMAWKSGMGKRALAEMEKLFEPRKVGGLIPVRILSMSFDSLMTKAGYDFMVRFLNATKCYMIIDESSRIKNPQAARTKRVLGLARYAIARRIASGTMLANGPLDVFAQMEFLRPGLLGTTSYRAFVAEYADLVPDDSPMKQRMVQRNPRAAFAQIVQKTPDGTPMWKNLEKLQNLMKPHIYRVTKAECLDLPPKVYKSVDFELLPVQYAELERLREDLRIEFPTGEIATVRALAAMMKAQQIRSGFVIHPDTGEVHHLVGEDENPALNALFDRIEDSPGPYIAWARFREEIDMIYRRATKLGMKAAIYDSRTSREDRELMVDDLQNGRLDFFIGQPQAGGIGLTLTAARSTFYFSNDFNYETRAQSEDRNHRIGTKSSVLYTDLLGDGTIDEAIVRSLRRKADVSAVVMGDFLRKPK